MGMLVSTINHTVADLRAAVVARSMVRARAHSHELALRPEKFRRDVELLDKQIRQGICAAPKHRPASVFPAGSGE